MRELPFKVIEYVKQHFDDPVIHSESSEKKNGRRVYKISVNETDAIHHLEFSENGDLMKSVVELKYDEDRYEQWAHEQTDFPF